MPCSIAAGYESALPFFLQADKPQGIKMSKSVVPATRNHLLQELPRNQREDIIASCQLVSLHFGDVLALSDQPYTKVYFPLTSLISLVVEVNGHPPLEMGMIGSEGMLGVTWILDVQKAPLQAVVQGSGTALSMNVEHLQAALHENDTMRAVLGRYLYVLMLQLSKTAACTHYHDVRTRLVRWLLMTNDRVHGDHFHLTHQFLADMLGVRRSAVTIAAGILQQQGFIRYTRGEITIINRKGLEAMSCDCYVQT